MEEIKIAVIDRRGDVRFMPPKEAEFYCKTQGWRIIKNPTKLHYQEYDLSASSATVIPIDEEEDTILSVITV